MKTNFNVKSHKEKKRKEKLTTTNNRVPCTKKIVEMKQNWYVPVFYFIYCYLIFGSHTHTKRFPAHSIVATAFPVLLEGTGMTTPVA